MSTRPGEHQGLGLAHYLWSSSPLRRYSDLVNQRQLLAVIAGAKPPVRGQRRGALRGARRFRGDVFRLRRVPGPDGALLVPALAAAGGRDRDDRRPSSARTSSASIGCRSSSACPTCRRSRPTRRCGSRSGASTSSKRRSSRATSGKPTRDIRNRRIRLERAGADRVARRATVAKASRDRVPPVGARPPRIPVGRRHALG